MCLMSNLPLKILLDSYNSAFNFLFSSNKFTVSSSVCVHASLVFNLIRDDGESNRRFCNFNKQC